MNKIIMEDMEILCSANYIPWSELENKTVFITGATGLIGSQIVHSLAYANRKLNLRLSIVANARDKKKAETCFKDLLEDPALEIIFNDINNYVKYSGSIDYIIHAASVTSSKDFVEKPVETIWTAINGTNNILKFAKEKHIKSMVYLSSLEVYGIPKESDFYITEDKYGDIDPLSIRSSYSESKRMVECMCCSYSSEYGIPVKIARLAQTFGPGVDLKTDNRVFAQFARNILEKQDIILNTDGSTVRSYCYNNDAVAGLFTVLLKGENGQAYNVANEAATVSIREMAELLAHRYSNNMVNLKIEVKDISRLGYLPSFKMQLASKKLEMLGWKATRGIGEMFDRMIFSVKDIGD